MARGASSNLGTEDWVAAYNAVMARGGPDNSGKKPGPGCCSICCTGFSIFAALFLFILASAMKSHYPYMHVHGDMNMMSKGVTYAGLAYLAFALLSMICWIKGIMQVRAPAAQTTAYSQVQ